MGLRELNVDLTKWHVALWKSTKEFLEKVWRPAAVELDQLCDPADVIAEGSILWDVLRKTFELGFHSMFIPKDFGGLELDPLSGALVTELMGWAAPDLAVSWGVCSTPFTWAMLSPDQEIQNLTRRFCADQKAELTGCWAITEPDHGSDWILFEGEEHANPKVAPQVHAVLEGDEYVINGQKSAWVSNGTFAKYAALWVTLDPEKAYEGGGVAVVPLDLPGVSRGKPLNKLGQRALNQGEIFFDNVRIPRKNMIAEDPVTFKLLSNGQLGLANGWMGSCFTGCAQAALEEALDYVTKRVQGGKTIFNHQAVKLRIFDMFASVEAARSLSRRVMIYNATQVANMLPPAVHYSMASKIMGTETAFRVASQAVQLFGGYGMSKEYLIEKIFRDARASLVEDGVNDTLAIDGADRIMKGRKKLVAVEGLAQPAAAAAPDAAAAPAWEELQPMFRPTGVQMGVMKVDEETCTKCGLCIQNCPFRAWEKDGENYPKLKDSYECFSCFNCMVACPVGAISIDTVYHVDEGVYKTDPLPLRVEMPREPKDAEGKATGWNSFERLIFERRSVRNFKPDPVPEPLIRRILEAGRFAPSSGNCQPWKFIVVTNKNLIDEMNDAAYGAMSMMYTAYTNDAMVQGLAPIHAQFQSVGLWDPRIMLGGVGSIVKKNSPVFLDAPCVIVVACDNRAIGGPQVAAGVCGQNMNLVAKSLGLGFCWVGFSQFLETVPGFKEDKLGLKEPWSINTAMVIGYPKFKQEGIVPREYRPVTWYREGDGSGVEE